MPPATAVVPPDVTAPPPPSPGTGTASPGSGGTGTPDEDPFAACVADAPANEKSTDAFVPFTPTGVRVCTSRVDASGATPAPEDEPADVAADLVAGLTKLPLLEPDTACTDIGGARWALLFTGADNVSELVLVDAGGCGTASNGVRTVKAGPAFFAQLTALG